jgi:hypothetical protein
VERDKGRALLSRKKLHEVAEQILPVKFISLGLALGFTYLQIKKFRHDNESTSTSFFPTC